MEVLTIGQVAKDAEVNIETIRYYERRGLIPEPPRSGSGYRRYPSSTINRVRFIKRAKELGFSLKEISDLLTLRVDPGTTCADVKMRAEAKIVDIERKIRALREMKRVLTKLALVCRGEGPTTECPILDAMDKEK